MVVLTVLWYILIGLLWLLGGLLGLAVLLILIVWFTPVSYKARFDGENADFKVKIMFGLVTVTKGADGGVETQILFFRKRGKKSADSGTVEELP
jgi:hypothetical protein